MAIFAHAGHWAASLIYFTPVVVIGAGIGITAWRDRRAEERATTTAAQEPAA